MRLNHEFTMCSFLLHCLLYVSVSTSSKTAFVKSDSISLSVLPVYSRPYKHHKFCLNFLGWVIYTSSKHALNQCPLDNDHVTIIDSPVVFHSQNFGVVKKLPLSYDKDLRRAIKGVHGRISQMTVSLYIYLTERYPRRSSIFHFLTSGGNLEAIPPLLLLEPNGDVTIETAGYGRNVAWVAHTKLELHVWYHLTLVYDRRPSGILYVCKMDRDRIFQSCLNYDFFPDVSFFFDYYASFVAGGSTKFVAFSGYIAQLEVFLDKALHPSDKSSKKASASLLDVEIAKFDDQCESLVEKVADIYLHFQQRIVSKQSSKSCQVNFYGSMASSYESFKCYPMPKLAHKHKLLLRVVKSATYGQLFETLNEEFLQYTGKRLYILARKSLGIGLHEVRYGLSPYIMQAACLGYGVAAYMSAVIHFTGFGVTLDEKKGALYLLRSAYLKERLGLLSLGFKYAYGLNGFPQDHSISWRYYIQAAWMFHQDRESHDQADLLTENVRLTDKAALEMHMGEQSDHFQWLKFQAQQGVDDAKQELGRLLFWGSRGVQRDMGAAVDYYRQLVEAGDVNGMFDLGIVLMRGQGVEKNEEKGINLLKLAAEKNHQGAISALGWHYLLSRNYPEAYHYLSKAAANNNPDALHNLGHMWAAGLVPGQPPNATEAYFLFIRGANAGQPDSSIAVSQGQIYGEGPMVQSPLYAHQWARIVAEQLPAIGKVLRQGLKSYLTDRMSEALMLYMMAAETGVEVAAYNMAYLCEMDGSGRGRGLAHSYIDSECCFKYYNLSLLSFTPHSYAVNKVGDYYFYGCSGSTNAKKASEYYSWAARMGDPQGYYNLAYMLQSGYDVSYGVKPSQFPASKNITSSFGLQMYLLNLCENLETSHNEEGMFSPCFLAKHHFVLSAFITSYWTEVRIGVTFLSTLVVVLLMKFLSHARIAAVAQTRSSVVVNGV